MSWKYRLGLGSLAVRTALPVAAILLLTVVLKDQPSPTPLLAPPEGAVLEGVPAWNPSRPPVRLSYPVRQAVRQEPALYPEQFDTPRNDLDELIAFDRLGWSSQDLFGDWWFFGTIAHDLAAWPPEGASREGSGGFVPRTMGTSAHDRGGGGWFVAAAPGSPSPTGPLLEGTVGPGDPRTPGGPGQPPAGGVDPTSPASDPTTIPEPVGLSLLAAGGYLLRRYLRRRSGGPTGPMS